MTLRVVGYNRVSTEEQAKKGYNIEEYPRKMRSYCDAKSWVLAEVYTDAGKSGRKIEGRDAYQSMMNRIRTDNTIDGIIVYKLDRLHRNLRNALRFFDDMEKLGKQFVSVMDNFDTSTAMGKAMLRITLVFAQLESEQMGERISLSRKAAKAKGHWPRYINPVFWIAEFGHEETPVGENGLVRPTDTMKEMYRDFSKKGEPTVLELAARYGVSDRAIYKNVVIYRAYLNDEIYGDSQSVCKVGGFVLGKTATVYTPKLPNEHFSNSPTRSKAIAFIKKHQGEYTSINKLCKAAGISPSSYQRYKARGWL